MLFEAQTPSKSSSAKYEMRWTSQNALPQGCGWVLGWIEVTVGTRWTTAKAASQPTTIAQSNTNKLSTHNQIQTNTNTTTQTNCQLTTKYKQIVNSQPNANTTTQTNCQPTIKYQHNHTNKLSTHNRIQTKLTIFTKHSWPPSLLNGQSDETNWKENTVWICDWRPLKAFSNLGKLSKTF